MNALLDTSVFVEWEQERAMRDVPEDAAISVVTLAELHIGVLTAEDPVTRAQRLRTLSEVERRFEPLPVDATVARQFAAMFADARRRGRRPQVLDLLIAATAAAHAVPVYTQDADFQDIPGVQVTLV